MGRQTERDRKRSVGKPQDFREQELDDLFWDEELEYGDVQIISDEVCEPRADTIR